MTTTRAIANTTEVYSVTDLKGRRIKILPGYTTEVKRVEHGTELYAEFSY
ncbi:MAG: hypothetical protein PHX34_04405 [Candidatus Shapirobacteria bacterium]|nr:hypothetical protein [Candidatus Shapirobacteria bacterium]